MSKHTLNGRRRKVIKTSGFIARLSTKSGRKRRFSNRIAAKYKSHTIDFEVSQSLRRKLGNNLRAYEGPNLSANHLIHNK